ncbi:hypothetical protein Belba_2236 [Belliella baltica DSM 15883]|uniref:Uncharacterized protein n=1 Tax=Belliella baltica (strain DSM 15883 / CIP 108006 / LMG 21964 / BA134) TaxID=866536 RepID=I3Z6D4_BELBD|nr:hypothetical protein [Belliella baltica]AFL84802.1 hypothetical protein Belba_2236 [Belliella baltica DSM 15883]
MNLKQLFNIFLSVSFFMISYKSQGQKEYQGEYKFNNINGKAKFQFVEDTDGKVIKQGEFSFVRKESDPKDKTRFLKTEIKGVYEQDKKKGSWTYLDEDHQLELEDIVDFELISNLESIQIKLEANYVNGIPNGKWKFEENEFSEGSLNKKAQAEEFLFKDGDIQGKFQFKSFTDDYTQFIRGELKDDGIMNGEWTFVYEAEGRLVSEVRKYEDGFLLGLVKRDLNNDDVIEEQVFFETIAKLNQVNAGENNGFRIADQNFGILFNDGFLSNSPEIKGQTEGNEFMTDFLKKILRYDESYLNQKLELIESPIHTKKFVFELNRNQQKIIEELPAKFDELLKVTQEFKERNALGLNRQKSDSLSATYSFFEFQNEKLKRFNELMDKIRTKEIQFYDVNYIAQEGLEFVSGMDKIKYNFGGEVKVLEIEYYVGDFKEDFYGALDAYVLEMNKVTSKFKAYAERQLSRIEQDSDLKNLEEKIGERKNQLDELYTGFEEKDELTQELLSAINSNILKDDYNRINERYAKSEQFSIKKDEANTLLDLLDEMESQYEVLSNISRNWEILDEYYNEEVINPFTYTNYDKRAKPRLFESAERLFEYYLERIAKEQDYTAIKIWTKKIESLIVKMSELRNEDTRSLERRLNRRSSISKIESDLEL